MATVDVNRLMFLREVGEKGSLTGAAVALGYSTSAVSQQVAKMEREVGIPLVERHPRGIRLTEAGAVLVRHAQRIEQTLAAAKHDVEEFAGVHRGNLRIGTFPTAGASLLPQAIVEIRRAHPGLKLSISSGRQDWLLAALRRHEVDLALLWDYTWARLDAPDLALEKVTEDPTVLLVPPNHALAGQELIAPALLAKDDWIVRADHPVSEVLERVCGDAGFTPHVVLAANDYQEVQGMVAAGLGVSLAPHLAVEHHRDDVRIAHLSGNPAPRRILLARLRDRRPSPAVRSAAEIIHSASTRTPVRRA